MHTSSRKDTVKVAKKMRKDKQQIESYVYSLPMPMSLERCGSESMSSEEPGNAEYYKKKYRELKRKYDALATLNVPKVSLREKLKSNYKSQRPIKRLARHDTQYPPLMEIDEMKERKVKATRCKRETTLEDLSVDYR
jgi:hypothetical protein